MAQSLILSSWAQPQLKTRHARCVRPVDRDPGCRGWSRNRQPADVALSMSSGAFVVRPTGGRLVMFVQVIRGQATDPQELRSAFDTWYQQCAPGARGWLGSTAGVTDDG